MAQYKTPGVYTVEKNAFPNSVGAVATAIPAFIGYTAKHDRGGKSLLNKTTYITSMKEFNDYFGGAPLARYTVTSPPTQGSEACTVAGVSFSLDPVANTQYYLHDSVRMFYANGGGVAYVVSVGIFGEEVDKDKLLAGLELLLKIDDPKPTMLVVPDATLLATGALCTTVQQQMLMQCADQMDRVAVLDIYGGTKARAIGTEDDVVANFRRDIGLTGLKYGAAYYPFLETTLYATSDVGYKNLENFSALSAMFGNEPFLKAITDAVALPDTDTEKAGKVEQAENSGKMNSLVYKTLLNLVASANNVLPPSGAVAGVYAQVDKADGVWQAPANINIAAVVRPTVFVTDFEQQDLNVDTVGGKSVNVIRSFPGRGSSIIWGARTLDGNSQDWRYINVRRTLIMIEQSIKNACFTTVFEPNVASTWSMVKSMIDNFLTNIWMQGGLQGAVPADAFSVMVGLGTTMSPQDILDGYMRVTVLVALVRPAEFIEITYQQQMPKS
jgi:phage tail sheath protein FI